VFAERVSTMRAYQQQAAGYDAEASGGPFADDEPVLAELARVLRPAGDLVTSHIHHELVTRGSVITARGPAGEPYIAATYRHQLGDYLRSALRLASRYGGARSCGPPRRSSDRPGPRLTSATGRTGPGL
jgi:hypothetical protein